MSRAMRKVRTEERASVLMDSICGRTSASTPANTTQKSNCPHFVRRKAQRYTYNCKHNSRPKINRNTFSAVLKELVSRPERVASTSNPITTAFTTMIKFMLFSNTNDCATWAQTLYNPPRAMRRLYFSPIFSTSRWCMACRPAAALSDCWQISKNSATSSSSQSPVAPPLVRVRDPWRRPSAEPTGPGDSSPLRLWPVMVRVSWASTLNFGMAA
mmetsp:Transcript_25819/g.66576  ORF Transcript_25819/g.66576 Transcript_25819/m.66576 type:complete len:214 (-) Transcript_25819:13-654(-)